MATKAFVGNVILYVGDGASPEAFVPYCEIDDVGGIGAKNDQVEATTFCSDGDKEFIAGLSEGNEASFGANYSLDDDVQEGLIDDVENKVNRSFQIRAGKNSPQRVFTFVLAMLSWEFDPAVSAQNKIKFTGKITGPIVRTLA